MAEHKIPWYTSQPVANGMKGALPEDAPIPCLSEHHRNDSEVVPSELSPLPQPREPWEEKELDHTASALSPSTGIPYAPGTNISPVTQTPSPNGQSVSPQKPARRKWLIIFAVAACVIIAVLIGVLAGVLSQRAHDANAPASASSSGTPTSSSSAANMTGTSTVSNRYLFPTAISWGYPHLEVVALTSNESYSIYRKYRNLNATSPNDWLPKGNAFELVGGSIDDGSAVALRSRQANSSLSLYINGLTGALYHKYHDADQVWTGKPSSWKAIGTRIVNSQPAVVSRDGLTDDIFFLANHSANTIQHVRWTNTTGWSNFEELGGVNMQFVPAAVSWDGNRIDVFGVGREDHHLYHTYWNGLSWSATNGVPHTFDDLGGFCSSTPIALSRTGGVIDVFARGGDGGLWHLSYNGTWSPWTLISGKMTIQAQPDAISWDATRIDVFAWGSENSLLTKTFNATTGKWTPSDEFEKIGSGLSGPPKALTDAPGSVHVFAYGQSNAVVWKHWNISESAEWPTEDFVQLGTPVF